MENLELPEEFKTHDGIVRWAVYGHGRPVVLLHGTPFSSAVWRNIAPALATDYQVYVWDMLGYGKSEMAAGQDVSLRAQAEIFAALLRHWELDSPALVAHDYGGTIALRAHLLHGARYDRLVLADPVALAPWGSAFFRLVKEHADVFAQLPPELHGALVREYISSASNAGLSATVTSALAAPWLTTEGQHAFYRQIAQADQHYTDEVQTRYPEIELPILVCWGEHDQWIPLSKGHELAGLLGNAPLATLRGAGHLIQEDAPEALLCELRAFLA